MMKHFEYLEHTADIKFRAYGRTPEQMLENAALALFSSMTDISKVQTEETWKVELSEEDMETLSHKWLSELVFLFETESAVFASFKIELSRNKECKLDAEIKGERIDLSRHAFDNEVKAVTLHEFKVRKNDMWCLQAVLDV